MNTVNKYLMRVKPQGNTLTVINDSEILGKSIRSMQKITVMKWSDAFLAHGFI